MKPIRGYADGPFGQLHYQVCGEGIPLILCHQTLTSSVQFQKAYPLLADAGVQAIGVDMPGFGMSDRPQSLPTIADYATMIPAILDHFDLGSASLLGHHTGSMIVNEAALLWPDRIDKVIHNGPVPFTDEELKTIIGAAVAREKAWHVKPDGTHLQELWDSRARATQGWTDLESMNRQVVYGLLAGEFYWYAHNAVSQYDQAAALKKLEQPTLILTNTGDGIYFLATRTREIRPDFAYVELEGGTHDIVDEQPEAWTEAVVAFLKA